MACEMTQCRNPRRKRLVSGQRSKVKAGQWSKVKDHAWRAGQRSAIKGQRRVGRRKRLVRCGWG
eukprot:554179-Rhodomonas_salina.1